MNLKRLYGITPEQYDMLRAGQDYRCAICGRHEDEIDVSRIGGRKRRDGTRAKAYALHVDHCHGSGEIRRLLCLDCNLMIGRAREDPQVLRLAAEYIEQHLHLKRGG